MRGVELLHPALRKITDDFIEACYAEGLYVKITDTLRTKAEQDSLYAQGRTESGNIVTNVKYPDSAHNWGVAFDICRNIKGREYDDSDGFFSKCGAIGKRLGLFWGGDFQTFVDKPHFEMPLYMPNNSTKSIKALYGTPEKFIETWQEDFTVERLAEMLPAAFQLLSIHQASEWANPALDWVKTEGIMQGDGAGNLMPKKPLTREEAAQMFYNFMKYTERQNV